MTERVCFLLQIKPDMLEQYLRAHEVVWPEMLEALSRTGWRNYSLFVRKPDGLVVGYLETDDYAAAQRAMDAEPINLRWQAIMGKFFALPEGARPDDGSVRLTEYFHLA
ncbi:L-rhamnose mutarotase [Nakamurella panacisegetis]|uniref:L-rhamnose mutarotase n=2 Tax=Nakamurella panacisegetis TaxID=1090615 RepID=A0A1H0KI71_9ACTN|nr:L-rhamnose mutarotase [Nakamurella panacisegetis]SDO55451.1 L-rhamnose mutarotase [Nakamurella panacisegetis]